ncbi:hypothetical protein PV325_001045 [Microctonus aethiopoides]|uniref:Protoporphyrinogen oxidase n=1 Tax=Microctonus aethiopoides TaxID=144406 RepID=A0AA39FRI1_9HYME|nr:hypothetical protein PV325_001045 [Microctonus aethiopoides]KAK0174155.1 hypothetical protein PV328_007264 [Microctonus aethiopoides]
MTVILGGGITGLSAAYYALENPKLGALTLLEASNRLGGWIRSQRSPNNIIFEKGPRTIRPGTPAGENTLNLIDKLELTDAIIPIKSSHPSAMNRLIYVNKKLHALPNSLGSVFKIKSPFRRPLITALWNDFRAPKLVKEDESIYSFVERRLGKDIADYLISPMICGICAGNSKKISAKFLMESFFEAEQQHGTIVKGMIKKTRSQIEKQKSLPLKSSNNSECKTSAERSVSEKWSVWSLQNGLEELPKKLMDELSSNNRVNIELNKRCDNITFKSDGVELEINGKIKKCSRVISSLPAKTLATLVKHQHPQLANELNEIPMVTVGVINFHFSQNILPMEAFGFLVPPSEQIPILGVIFDSCMFKQGPTTVLTVMMGGDWFEQYFGQNPTKEYLLSVALENLKTILNIKDDPVEVDVSILKDCIPQYIVGHSQRCNRIHDYISSHGIPLTLCGSSYEGVGINDVILSAKNAIDNLSTPRK